MTARCTDGFDKRPGAVGGHKSVVFAARDWSSTDETNPTLPIELPKGVPRSETSHRSRRPDPVVVSFKGEHSRTQSLRRVGCLLVGGVLVTIAVAHVTRSTAPHRARQVSSHPLPGSPALGPPASVKEIKHGRPVVARFRRNGDRKRSVVKLVRRLVTRSREVKWASRIADEPAPVETQRESNASPTPETRAPEGQFSYLGR
jgi:hypothetical protein